MSISSGIVQPEIVESGASDYMALLKPRVMSLVVFTGLVGLLLAPGTLHPVLTGIAVLCIAIGAGASPRPASSARSCGSFTRGTRTF